MRRPVRPHPVGIEVEIAMRVDTTTGYASATREMDAVPSRGDIFHIAEFTYIVAQVEWKVEGGIKYPCLWLLPLVGKDPRLTGDLYPLNDFFGPPREGDVVTAEGQKGRVICVEWFVNQTAARDSVSLHIEKLSEEDPYIAVVLQDAEEYGRRYTKAGNDPM